MRSGRRRLFPGSPFGASHREYILISCRPRDLLRWESWLTLLGGTSGPRHREDVPASSTAQRSRCTLDAMHVKLESRATLGALDNHLKSLVAHLAPLENQLVNCRKVSVTFLAVQPVTDHEALVEMQAHVIQIDLDAPAFAFVDKSADAERARPSA